MALRRVVVRHGSKFRLIEAADAALADGFHSFEPENGFRWTAGDAVVPTELRKTFAGPVEDVLTVACRTRYVATGVRAQAA